MAKSLRAAAAEYEPSKIGNVADLMSVSLDEVEIETKTYGDGEKAFTIDVIVVDGVDYRFPVSVLGQLQALMNDEKVADFENFRVVKTGTGINGTKYSVSPFFD